MKNEHNLEYNQLKISTLGLIESELNHFSFKGGDMKRDKFFLQFVYMYKADPTCFQQTHSYNTRNRSNLIPTFQRTVLTQRSLLYSAPNVWDQIPTEIKTLLTSSTFK